MSLSDYGRVTVVCTGNVARSPALAAVLHKLLPDIVVTSAAVGRRAVAGAPVKRAMRQIMEREGYGDWAGHRSILLAEMEWEPDLLICVAPVHMQRVKEIMPGVSSTLCNPVIPDPAFGEAGAYERAWELILRAADDILGGVLMPGIDWSYGD